MYEERDYVRQPIMESEVNAWRAQGYTHESFSGEMSLVKDDDTMNIIIFNLERGLEIKMANPGTTLYKMKTGDIMPVHIDHFNTYCRIFNVDRANVFRALVMLEDWKPGHYLEMAGEGVVNWKAGDVFWWSADTPHAAANIGIEDRYTLQVTFWVDGISRG